jgi:hypothetical protein
LTRTHQDTDRADQRRGHGHRRCQAGCTLVRYGRPMREIIAAASNALDDLTLERRISQAVT